MFECDDSANIDGTSWHGVEVTASLEVMVKLFGDSETRGDSKTKHEWRFVGERFNVAVYDYKYDGSVAGYWHVGTNNHDESLEFSRWFRAHVSCYAGATY